MKKILAMGFLALSLSSVYAEENDPMEASARKKIDRPWFAQFMSGEPLVVGLPGETEADRLKRVKQWSDASYGLFLHWGPQKSGGEKTINAKTLNAFNPTEFDADEWVLSAKDLGFKYIVITTKHHAGFCMFDSKFTDHDIMDATPFGRDPMKELADACAKHGMLLGFYYSVWDLKHPNYSGGIGSKDYAVYHQYMLDQTTELLTNYGPIITIWMDGEWVNSWTVERASDYRNKVNELQPDLVFVDRIGQRRHGDGDYGSTENFTPYTGDNLDGRFWESCQRFDGKWFYAGKDTSQSLEWALHNLIDTVSGGGNLLMNMGPTPEGLLPPVSLKKLKPMGDWLRKHGESIYAAQRGPHYLLEWGRCTRKDNTLYYHIMHWPEDGKLVIPGLNLNKANAGVQKITFLGESDAEPVKFEQIAKGVALTLPTAQLDPLMSVLKVELDSAPVVDNALRPLTRPLRKQQGDAKVKVGDYYLAPGFATIHGKDLHYSLGAGAGGQRENLKGWLNADDYASWEINVEKPGEYDVVINISSWMDSGKFALEVGGETFEHKVVGAKKTKGRKSPFSAAFKPIKLGKVNLDTVGKQTVTLKALEITPKAIEYSQGLMLTREVILSKAK